MQKVAATVTAALSEVPGVLQPVQIQTMSRVNANIRVGTFPRNRDSIFYEIVSFDVYEEDKDAFEAAFQYIPQQAPPFSFAFLPNPPLSASAKLTSCI